MASIQRQDDPDPDLEVLARVADGDGEAFTLLVERHQGRVVRLCGRLLGDSEDALDAAQDIFLKVYRKAGSYRPQGRVSTWLHRIAVNHCLNRLRRRRLVRFFSLTGDDDAPLVDPVDASPEPTRRLEARRRWARTRAAIDALPVSQRAVLVLAKFEGLSYRQIAETLEITVSAVESRLFRAMRTISARDDEFGGSNR